MNKIDVLYKNYNIQSSGFKDLFKNCDLSLFTSDEKFSKILTKASITKYALKQQQKQRQRKHDSSAEICTVFKKHPRNFDNDDLVSSDSRESITNDHILRTKFQRQKKNFEQFKQLLPKDSSDENLWEGFNPIINNKFAIENNNMECVTKLKRSRDNIKIQSDNESLASLDNNTIQVQKVPKVKKSREKVDENIQTINQKTVKTEMNNNATNDDILGVNLTSILLKIGGWLGELSTVIHEGISPIDGAEDYVVRETRCKEFATRFSRQYDYEFSRLLGMLRTLLPRISNRLTVNRVAQNITKSCQIVLQAIMQYCSHIPTTLTSIEKKQYNVHLKFHQMLKNILEFLILVKKIGKTFLDVRNSLDTVEEVEKKCGCLMLLIEEKFMKPPSLPIKSQPKIVKTKVPPKDKKSPYQNQSIEKRLSMYSMSFKNRSGKALGPKRINVQSRYKTAGIVKAPVSDNTEQEKKDAEKKKLAQKRSSQILCDGSSSTIDPPRINEDEIETMVEKVAKSTRNNLHLNPNNHELRNKVETLLQSWSELTNEKKEDATNNKEMIVTQMLNLFEQLQDGSQKFVTQNLLLGKANSEHDELAKSQISVTGPKNAKLIFIKDKSLYGSLSNTTIPPNSKHEIVPFKIKSTPKKNDENNEDAMIIATLPLITNQHREGQDDDDVDNKKIENVTKSTIIVKKTLTKVKEKSFINILKYRKDYQVFTSHNHMYRKGRVQPWHITNKIAERLLTNLLFSVLSEINLNEIVEQIYKAEFE